MFFHIASSNAYPYQLTALLLTMARILRIPNLSTGKGLRPDNNRYRAITGYRIGRVIDVTRKHIKPIKPPTFV